MSDEALRRFRDWLARGEFGPEGRLPPERTLAPRLGLSRAELRRALAVVTADGILTRHVGRGTFLTSPPRRTESWPPGMADHHGADPALETASPRSVLQARLALEPELAALAVLNAAARDLGQLRSACASARAASTWPAYDLADAAFHRALAAAAGNATLLHLHDVLARLNQAIDWGALRVREALSPTDHPSHGEHEAVVAAIAARDRHEAADALRHHLLVEATACIGQSA